MSVTFLLVVFAAARELHPAGDRPPPALSRVVPALSYGAMTAPVIRLRANAFATKPDVFISSTNALR